MQKIGIYITGFLLIQVIHEVADNKITPKKTFAVQLLFKTSLFLQEDHPCKPADAVLIPLTDHLNVILHPVCITADNCPLKSATIEVTMSY